MEGWKKWVNKKVFVETRSNRKYSGVIINVDDSKPPLIWITLIDKYGDEVMLVHSEINLIQEEKR